MDSMEWVSTQDLRILVDTIVDSLDYGSGFLDNESLGALDRTAKLLGIDLNSYRAKRLGVWSDGPET